MIFENYGICLGYFFLVCLLILHPAVSDTRYECITGGFGGRYDDEYEADEMGRARMFTSGTLSCPLADQGSILVLRVGYGSSVIPGRCESDTFCKEEYDTADIIADRCDGRSSCFIDLLPRYMSCGRMSDYMLVEYECIDSWKTFEVCEKVSTVSRGASVFITSPGYLNFRPPAATRGTQMCECIIQSQDNADLFLDYMQTQISKAGDTCPYEYVLLESKKDLNQSSIDKEIEICGRRHIGNKWFSGAVRLTYASGGPMRRNGLVAKFTVDNVGNSPNIEIECGSVNASGMKLKDPPPALSETQAGTVSRTRIPSDPYLDPRQSSQLPPFSPLGPSRNLRSDFDRYLSMDEMEADEGPYDDVAERMLRPYDDAAERIYPPVGRIPPLDSPPLSPLNRTPLDPPLRRRDPPPPSRAPAPRPRDPNPRPDFSNWKINIPDTPVPGIAVNPALKSAPAANPSPPADRLPPRKKATAPRKAAPTVKAQTVGRPVQRVGKGVVRQRIPNKRRVPTRQGPKKVVDESLRPAESTDQSADRTDTGSYVALVMAGIGALLIVGSFGIIAYHNYRRRQRIKAEEAEYAISGGSASSTYGQGWDREDESVYATISDVDKHRTGCVNPAVSQELDLNFSHVSADTFVGQHVANDCKSDTYPGLAAPDNAYVTQETKSYPTEIAVIEVHQSFEGSDDIEKHTEGCLPSCEYSVVNHENRSENLCSLCNITRPPRRKDTSRGYDNNIGIKHKNK